MSRFLGLIAALALAASPTLAQQTGAGGGSSSTGANPSASAGLSAVNGSATTFMRSDAAPAISQTIAPTWSGDHIFSAAGALSAPAVSVTGAPIATGGTATTTKPLVLIETAGATSNAWSTTGTMLGVNAPSGFTGDVVNFAVGGASRCSINSVSQLTCGGSITLGTTGNLTFNGRFILSSPTGSQLSFGGTDAGAVGAQTLSFQSIAAGTSNTAGANATIQGSSGTGTGVGGSIILQTAPHGTTGSTKNAEVTGFVLDEASHVTQGGAIPTCGTGCSSIATGGTDQRMAITSGAGVTAVTVNFAKTWLNSVAPVCVANSSNSTDVPSISAVSTTALTVTLSAALTGTLYILCG